MTEKTGWQKDWEDINKFLSEQKRDSDVDMIYLGRLFKEYVEESIHSGFDGFQGRDVTGIRRMLADLVIYARNR